MIGGRKPRSERYAAAKALRDKGMVPSKIAVTLGLSDSYVRRLLNDPDGHDKRLQRARLAKDPVRMRILRERNMKVTTRTLADATPQQRYAGAQRACCDEECPRMRHRLLAAALWPEGFPEELARYVEDIIEGEAAALLEPVAA